MIEKSNEEISNFKEKKMSIENANRTQINLWLHPNIQYSRSQACLGLIVDQNIIYYYSSLPK